MRKNYGDEYLKLGPLYVCTTIGVLLSLGGVGRGGHYLCSDGSFEAFVGSEHKIVISSFVTIIRYSSLLHEGNTIIPLVMVIK